MGSTNDQPQRHHHRRPHHEETERAVHVRSDNQHLRHEHTTHRHQQQQLHEQGRPFLRGVTLHFLTTRANTAIADVCVSILAFYPPPRLRSPTPEFSISKRCFSVLTFVQT